MKTTFASTGLVRRRPPEKLINIAEKCADALFTACDGKPCHRLQLMRGKYEREEETNMGGWCRGAIVDQIVDVLMESLPNAKDQATAK